MIKMLFAYLLVKPEQLVQHYPRIWKTSIRRILLLSILVLIVAIVFDVIVQTYQLQHYSAILVNTIVYSMLVALLFLPNKYFKLGTTLLILVLMSVVLCILSINYLEFTKLGVLFLYTLPISYISDVKRAKKLLIEYKKAKQNFKYHDYLTQLPSRRYLLEILPEHISKTTKAKQMFGVMTFRVSYFRYIDQKYGTAMGDILLRTLAKKVAELTKEHLVVARLRGIVFCIVTKGFDDYHSIQRAVESLYQKLPALLTINAADIRLSYNSGVSVCPVNTTQSDELIKQSETALDFSRTAFSTKPVFFDSYLNVEQNNQIEIELTIKRALENGDFYTVFQPKVLYDGTIVGAEALIRMESHGGEIIDPDLFIPAAERCGLICDVEKFSILNLCKFIRSHIDRGVDLVPIAVNISSQMIGDTQHVDSIIQLITEQGVPPSKIELEITETSLAMGKENSISNLVKLREFGIAISIDDFGTGYSSLGKIIDMPVSTLKIDRSFLREVPHNKKHVTLVRTIINLGKQLNLKLVAEGVEHAEQLTFLCDEGCEIFQGYYFYKPMVEDDFNCLLARRQYFA